MKREKKTGLAALLAALALAALPYTAAQGAGAPKLKAAQYAQAHHQTFLVIPASSLPDDSVPLSTQHYLVIPDAPATPRQMTQDGTLAKTTPKTQTSVELAEEEIPLSALPGEQTSRLTLSETILPLLSTPKTRDSILFWGIGTLIAGMNLLWMFFSDVPRRNDEDT